VSEPTITIEVHADSELELLEFLIKTAANRDIPVDECLGAFGWVASPIPRSGVLWTYDDRLPPFVAVIWHRRAVVPPGLVVNPKAIIYGRVGHNTTARYLPSEAA